MNNYFRNAELNCNCCGFLIFSEDFRCILNDLREYCGHPFYITSGYRCEKHNTKVGGSPTSYHLEGRAVDISRHNMNGEQLRKLIQTALNHDLTVGIASSFVHIDDRDSGIIYTYSL